MKKLILLSLGFLLVSFGTINAQSKPSASDYNNSIVAIQTTVINDILALSNTFESRDAATMDKKYKKLKQTTVNAVNEITKMKGYEGNTELRDVAKNLFVFYKETVANEYAEMIGILKKPDAEITEKDIARIDEISSIISARESVLDERFAKAQSDFAAKYNVVIKENNLQKEIDNMSK
jgi:hypothetical protein